MSLKGWPQPLRRDGHYEYTYYLTHNGAGDEFRANQEVITRFFNPDGSLKPEQISALHEDIALLLWPSPQRALQLNKAYWLIVQEQSFKAGRDALITSPKNVHDQVKTAEPTGIKTVLTGHQ